MRKFWGALCCCLVGAGAVASDVIVIDFDDYHFENGIVNNIGDVIVEQGFVFTKGDGEPNPFAAFGVDNAGFPGSAAVFNNTVGGLTRLEREGGAPFNLLSIDVANLGGGGPTTLALTGFKSGGGAVSASITHSGTGPTLDRLVIAGFTDVVAVEWTQDSPFHQFDRVTVDIGANSGCDVTKSPDQGPFWNPLGPSGTYAYANSFEACSYGSVDRLGMWLENLGGDSAGRSIRFMVLGSKNNDPANGPDGFDIVASTNQFFPDIINGLAYFEARVAFGGPLTPGETYWFVASCVNSEGAGSWRVGGHTQNSEYHIDNGTFWFSNDPDGHEYDGAGLTPEMAFKVIVNTTAGATIDNDDFEFANADVNVIGQSFLEDNYVFEQGDGRPNPFHAFGQQHPAYPGSAAVFNNTVNGVISVEHKLGYPFWVASIDLAPLNAPTPVSVEFTGYTADGATVSTTFTHSGDSVALETFAFPFSFTDLERLEWSQTSPFHQFDNLRTFGRPRGMEHDAQKHDGSVAKNVGTLICESAQVLTKGEGEPHAFFVRGEQDPSYPGSAAVFNNTVNGVTTMARNEGGRFDLLSIDLAPLNNAEPVTVEFTGFKYDGGSVTTSFTHPGDAIELISFEFPSNFNDLGSVQWVQASPYHQFDNITIGPPTESCPPDCNTDGALNILDFVCFQASFLNGDPSADCDENGLLNVLDFVCYQQAFLKGCD